MRGGPCLVLPAGRVVVVLFPPLGPRNGTLNVHPGEMGVNGGELDEEVKSEAGSS